MNLSLATSTPNVLQQTIPLCQPVQRVIALTHRPDKTAECVNLTLACEPTVVVNFANRDLDRRVVLGLDNAVGCAAFARNIAKEELKSALLELLKTEISLVAIEIVRGLTGRQDLLYHFPFWRLFDSVSLRSRIV